MRLADEFDSEELVTGWREAEPPTDMWDSGTRRGEISIAAELVMRRMVNRGTKCLCKDFPGSVPSSLNALRTTFANAALYEGLSVRVRQRGSKLYLINEGV